MRLLRNSVQKEQGYPTFNSTVLSSSKLDTLWLQVVSFLQNCLDTFMPGGAPLFSLTRWSRDFLRNLSRFECNIVLGVDFEKI